MRKLLLISLFLLLCLPLAFKVRAALLHSVTEDVKQLINSDVNQFPAVSKAGDFFMPAKMEIVIDTSLALAEGGDLNLNGQLDPGEVVEFRYTITNPTNTTYPQATLDTHISRGLLNFIHDVQGVSSLIDNGKSIIIPYLSLPPYQTQIISFKANVNLLPDADAVISTEADLSLPEQIGLKQNVESNTKNKLGKAAKKEILVKKNSEFKSGGQVWSKPVK